MIRNSEGKLTKVAMTIVGVAVGGILSWGVWVTNKVYCADKDKAVFDEKSSVVSRSIDEVKKDVKDIKQELKEQNEKAHENQEQILNMLIEMEKSNRRHD